MIDLVAEIGPPGFTERTALVTLPDGRRVAALAPRGLERHAAFSIAEVVRERLGIECRITVGDATVESKHDVRIPRPFPWPTEVGA